MYLKAILLLALLLSACKAEVPTEEATPEVVTVVVEAMASGAGDGATATPYPTYTPYPTNTPAPTNTPSPTDTPAPTSTPAMTTTLVPTDMPTPTPTQAPAKTAEPAATSAPATAAPSSVSTWALTVLEDNTPAPPLSIHVSANRAFEGHHYKVTGVIRNDGDQNYTGLGVVATFYTDKEDRHGPIKVNGQCLLIAPGEICPFEVEATAKNLVSVELHPEGYPTDRGAAPTNISGLSSYRDAVGYVHVTGYAHNPNPFTIKNVTANGVLQDANGQIVSQGMDVLLPDIAPNQSAKFTVMIRYAPYSTYQIYVQAEPQ